jgi:hypothetical protein
MPDYRRVRIIIEMVEPAHPEVILGPEGKQVWVSGNPASEEDLMAYAKYLAVGDMPTARDDDDFKLEFLPASTMFRPDSLTWDVKFRVVDYRDFRDEDFKDEGWA